MIIACVGFIFVGNLLASLSKSSRSDRTVPAAPGTPPSVPLGPGLSKKANPPNEPQSSRQPGTSTRPRRGASAVADGDSTPSTGLLISGRTAVGAHLIFKETKKQGSGPSGTSFVAPDPGVTNAEQIRQMASSPLDKLRAATILAELGGREAALAELDEVQRASRSADGSATSSATGPTPRPRKRAAALTPLQRDVRSLRTIYTRGPDALDDASKQSLIRRHGWFGELAVSWGKPESDPVRKSAVAPAYLAFKVGIAILVIGVVAFLVGLVLAVLAIVLYTSGRLRSAYAPSAGRPPSAFPPPFGPAPAYGYGYPPALPQGYPPYGFPPPYGYPPPPPGPYPGPYSYAPVPPPPPWAPPPAAPPQTAVAAAPGSQGSQPAADQPVRGGPFVEAFAIFLAGLIGVGFLLHLLIPGHGLAWQWVMVVPAAVAILWPRWRGIEKAEWKRALGWHTGRGVLREVGAGIVGYMAGLPLLAVGVLVTLLLNYLAHAHPTHPIQNEVGRGVWTTVQLYLIACVWAPITEETMFRGALFHHLRRFGKGWSWLPSAALVAFLFAAIHPQGWTAIPVLGMFAVVVAGLREWRGSLIASMTGHFIQNLIAVTILVVMTS